MARDSAFSVKFDTEQLLALAQRLGAVSSDALGGAMVNAINLATDSAYELGRKRILSGINLTDDYVKRKMGVTHATAAKPEASITAYGSRKFLTNLSHYGALQLHQPAKWPKRSKGNPAIGIPAGRKADGRSVEVVHGRRKRIGPAFAIPGRKDADGNLIMFTRKGKSRAVKALTGPSVYQLFRVAIPKIQGEVADSFEGAVITAAERYLRDAL